jgi:hypothetical protein
MGLRNYIQKRQYGQFGPWEKFDEETVDKVIAQMDSTVQVRELWRGSTFAGTVIDSTSYAGISKELAFEAITAYAGFSEIYKRGEIAYRIANNNGKSTLLVGTTNLNLISLSNSSNTMIITPEMSRTEDYLISFSETHGSWGTIRKGETKDLEKSIGTLNSLIKNSRKNRGIKND